MNETIAALAGISAAFGLSGSAGLNAYIPLLVVAVFSKITELTGWKLLELGEPWDVLSSWWIIGLISVLLVVEILVDKVPTLDTANDIVQTFVRPAAGAILFAASANVITDIHPILALACGLLVAGSVHAAKSVVRPAATVTTAGMANPVLSATEDVVATIVSILAVVVPILLGFLLISLLVLVIFFWRKRRKKASI